MQNYTTGISKTKFCKNGQPKRSGHYSIGLGIQSQSYPVELKDGILIVGDHTPLSKLMPGVEWLAANDPYFSEYRQTGTHTYKGEQYHAEKTLSKSRFSRLAMFRYTEIITTHHEFTYNFPEY